MPKLAVDATIDPALFTMNIIIYWNILRTVQNVNTYIYFGSNPKYSSIK
jgi:hypothetical protein